ncbi:M20/M25/M40 family metallo-hydrolase [Pseudomonas sp. v388]|nr:M20/M25/M40 family metallo-hydrolase [Pseudomonas sp. v388]
MWTGWSNASAGCGQGTHDPLGASWLAKRPLRPWGSEAGSDPSHIDACRFDFEIRALPALDPWQVAEQLRDYAEHALLPAMRAVSGQSDIRFTELSSYPGLVTAAHSQAAQWVAQFSGCAEFGTVAFGTEGGLFDQAGIPTVVCGPGSMDQGHKPDEYVSIAQLDACDRMLERVLAFVCAA